MHPLRVLMQLRYKGIKNYTILLREQKKTKYILKSFKHRR